MSNISTATIQQIKPQQTQGSTGKAKNSAILDLDKQYFYNIGKVPEMRRLSKNPRRISKSKFNEMFGYETKVQAKKPGAIEKNKFNLKIKNYHQMDSLGYSNYYDATTVEKASSPDLEKRSNSRGARMSLNTYYNNPLDAEEFIPKKVKNSEGKEKPKVEEKKEKQGNIRY